MRADWVPDDSATCVVVTADADRWHEIFEPAVRTASAADGRSLQPERVDPRIAADAIGDDKLGEIESGAALLVDLVGLPAGFFAYVAALARARPMSVVLVRPTGVALPYAVQEFAVRTLDTEVDGATQRAAVARWVTIAAAERAREDALGARLVSPGTSRALRMRRERKGIADDLRTSARALLAGDTAGALAAARAAGARDPVAPDLALREALLWKETGNWAGATAALDRALELDDRSAAAWRELGLVRERSGAPGAEDALRHAIEIAEDPAALVALAFLVQRDGRADEALGFLERATEASEGQLTLVLPAVVLRAARDESPTVSDRDRARLLKVLEIRGRQAAETPPADAPWSHFDAATANLLLGAPAEAARLAAAARGHVHAAWQGDVFARTLAALERAKIDTKPVREAAGLPPPRPPAPRPPPAPKGLPFRALARAASWFAKNVPCATACPVGTDAGTYVALLAHGRIEDAYRVARGPNPFASVCARVCAAPCEDACRRGAIDAPVAIRPLKRFLTERHGAESGASLCNEVLTGDRAPGIEGPAYARHLRELGAGTVTGRRVAVIGGGPAGLACAHDLAVLGHKVTVFEATSRLGGMMRHGIPQHRLPRGVLDAEIGAILDLGVDVRMNETFGPERGIHTLLAEGYEAVFLSVGAGRGRDLDVEGAQLDGVVRAIDYLINVHRGYKMNLGSHIVVVGGGNVALDVARTMRRGERSTALPVRDSDAAGTLGPALPSDELRTAVEGGPAEVHVIARQPIGEWPAQKSVHGREEVVEALQEGVVFHGLRGLRRIVGRDGRVAAVELAEVVRLRDETGRYAPLYGDHVAETIPCDAVLLAVGQEADEGLLASTPGLERTPDGFVKTDRETLATTLPGVFAGGDVAFGPRTLIEAVAEGKRAARSIHAGLSGGRTLGTRHHFTAVHPRDIAATPDYDSTPRAEPPTTPLDRRTGIAEVEGGYDEASARREAARCLSCHVQTVYEATLCIACSRCVDICPNTCLALVPEASVDVNPKTAVADLGGPVAFMLKDEDRCIRCGLCAERCPTGAMTMERYETSSTGVVS